jgi:hypothetical protein
MKEPSCQSDTFLFLFFGLSMGVVTLIIPDTLDKGFAFFATFIMLFLSYVLYKIDKGNIPRK